MIRQAVGDARVNFRDTEPIETNNAPEGKTMNKFEANGKTWMADDETLALLRQYRAEGNEEMLGAVFELGKSFGRILPA